MLKSIKVRSYMTRHPLTFRPEMDLFTAIERLLKHGLTAAPVVDARGELIGILSEADCLRATLAGAYHDDAHGAVGQYMTVVPDTIDVDADIIKAAEGLLLDQRQRLPVLDNGRLVGVLSRHDVLRAVKAFAWHDTDRGD
ncbi:CBS domain-containing protein [Pseudomonas sp. GCM10022188]|uniref:CBS domain-containing protein n=1 Tax=Pseudomonas TaxID=286 RepID=UPI001E2D37C7|nr:CBS domain-containing protein [Pseudomonas oryzagri]MCC6074592.1 CBS domain-containing protein [Pseudomonas oryzagri]